MVSNLEILLDDIEGLIRVRKAGRPMTSMFLPYPNTHHVDCGWNMQHELHLDMAAAVVGKDGIRSRYFEHWRELL